MVDKKSLEDIVYDLILAIGEDPERDGLRETPKRVSEMIEKFFLKDKNSLQNLVKTFEENSENLTLIEIKDIPFVSFCEHHMLPFRGVAHIKYLPKKNFIVGISKFARIVDYFSKGLQVQERITSSVANFIYKNFPVKGVEVVLEAEHLCMTTRGANAVGSVTKTVSVCGSLKG